MPYDSGGLFSLVPSYKATSGQTIRTEQHNPPLEDIANGLSSALVRDGRNGMVGTLTMGGFGITNLKTGIATTDAATVGQIGATYGAQVLAATEKVAPVDADFMPIYDSAVSNVLKKLTWANLKAALKTYLDTLYPPVARTVSGAGLATGGGDLSANRTISVTEASQAQAQAGAASDVAMTPRRTTDAMNARIYTGSSQDQTDFPLGHNLLVYTPIALNRNQSSTIYLSSTFSNRYTNDSGDSAGTVAGTWRSRGTFQGVSGFNFAVMQRVA